MSMLEEIAVELGKDLERLQYAGKTVTVKYKVGSNKPVLLGLWRPFSCILSKVNLGSEWENRLS